MKKFVRSENKSSRNLKSVLAKTAVSALLIVSTASAFTVPASASSASSSAGIVKTASTGLNVRASASTSAAVKKSLPKDSYISLVSKDGSWWKVEYADGTFGYCSADYISVVSSDIRNVKTTSGRLNVRSGAGTSYSIKTTLASGTQVIVLSESNGWAKVLYDGSSVGYVSTDYLVKPNAAAPSAPTQSGPVSLKVPAYKQLDSRWKNVKLGNSSKTVGSSGCTTTCFAMAYSYLRNTTVYPDELARTFTYSSVGDLYWPAGTTQYFGSDYLKQIEAELRAGRPVLVGSKTAAGGQHWVLVTGYNGKGLSPENFTINDPGVASRTTLKQFFESFPVYYKSVFLR